VPRRRSTPPAASAQTLSSVHPSEAADLNGVAAQTY
jgi:hypothetical protein